VIIAIDGSAASGKGTLAKAVAAHFGYDYLDTGALYRALALHLINVGMTPDTIDENQCVDEASRLNISLTKDPHIRSDAVATMASKIAAISAVRQHLLALQRNFATSPQSGRGAVLDGRDIGTVVLPDANIKFFIDASPEVRARRRTKELRQAGQSVMFRDVLADMQARDMRDRTRSVAPLAAADDAITIDTSDLDAATVLAQVLHHIGTASRSE
jgi:cytidylate kinase